MPRRKPQPSDPPIVERRIMALCEMLGVGPGRLGKDAGLSDESVPRLIKEARSPRRRSDFPGALDTYRKLADRYGVTINWLVGLPENPTFIGKKREP